MTSRYGLIFYFLLVINSLNAYPNDKDSLKENQSVKKKDRSFILSLRGGYHTSDVQTSLEGFPGGFVFDVKILTPFGNKWHGGFLIDYWWAKDDNFPSINGHSTYQRDYKTYGIAFVLEKKNKIGVINLNYGFGLGRYVIGYSFYGGNDTGGYLNLCFVANADLFISENTLLNAEISYYSLFSFERTSKVVNFKMGPSIIF